MISVGIVTIVILQHYGNSRGLEKNYIFRIYILKHVLVDMVPLIF